MSANRLRGTAKLGQLEHDLTTMAHDPGADFDQLLRARS
jgi:hypothetical protein